MNVSNNQSLYKLVVKNTDKKNRLDKFLSIQCRISRNIVQRLIDDGNVKLFSHIIKDKDYLIKADEFYEVIIPKAKTSHIKPSNIALNIVHEDRDIIVINKPPGMVMHPGIGTDDQTLVNALVNHCENTLSSIGGVIRPGIVHRIDKDTSGLVVIAKNETAHYWLSSLFSLRKVKKEYHAIVWGTPLPNCGVIENNISVKRGNHQLMTVVKNGGKNSVTEYQVMESFGIASLVKCILHTGRTHQIRVHMSYIGNSIVGDQKYGKNNVKILRYAKKNNIISHFNRQALHAYKLEFNHPTTHKNMEFIAEIPHDMQMIIDEFIAIKNNN